MAIGAGLTARAEKLDTRLLREEVRQLFTAGGA